MGRNILIAAVQETNLNENCSLQSCNVLRKVGTRSEGGGLVFLLHHSAQYRLEQVSSDPDMKCMEVEVKCGTIEVEVLNVSNAPVNSCEPHYLPYLSRLL